MLFATAAWHDVDQKLTHLLLHRIDTKVKLRMGKGVKFTVEQVIEILDSNFISVNEAIWDYQSGGFIRGNSIVKSPNGKGIMLTGKPGESLNFQRLLPAEIIIENGDWTLKS